MLSQENMAKGEILLYQTEDNGTRIEVRLQGETVWLTQAQMAELFQTTKQNISLHAKNVFEEGELEPKATVKDSLIVQKEGDRRVSREVSYYNLDDFIRFNERELLTHAGKISHQQAVEKARVEYDKYRALTADEPSLVEQHFVEAMQAVTRLELNAKKDK